MGEKERKSCEQIGIVGTGLIGTGLAALFIANGYHVHMMGINDSECLRGENGVRENLYDLVKAGILPESYVNRFMQNLTITQSYEALCDVTFVLEAVFERLDVKHSVYRKLEEYCGEHVIIASATSAISADELAGGLIKKNRLIVAHPWNPPHLIPCVEIVKSSFTDESVLKYAIEILESIGRKVVVLNRSIEGFIGNRIMHAMYREALYLLEQGIASAQDIDRTILYSFGPRFESVGVLEYYDSCGLDLQNEVQTYLFPTLCTAQGPQKPVLHCLEQGKLGPKTGGGIYDWPREHQEEFRYRKSKPFFQYFKWIDPEEQV